MKIFKLLTPILLAGLFLTCNSEKNQKTHHHDINSTSLSVASNAATSEPDTTQKYEVVKTPKQWKQILTAQQYNILRESGTERPFSNAYWDNKKEGIYYCAACGQPLYSSKTKFRSGTGWPSFWEPVEANLIEEKIDNSLWVPRTEVVCSRCGSHLGHIFEDGPEPTGLRHCLNSAALVFKEMDLSKIDEHELSVVDVH